MRVLGVLLVLGLIGGKAGATVVTKDVEYKDGDVTLKGYLAYDDAAKGKRPGVLIVHEWWGLNDYTKSRAKQLAELGYVAFALDMYGEGQHTTKREEAQNLCGKVMGDVKVWRKRAMAGLDQLLKQENVDPKKVAAIGYCFGGTTALNLAYAGAPVAGVVSFHGSLQPPQPDDKEIKAKILVCHGADDPFIPGEQIDAFQEAMQKAGCDWQMIFYGGAVHSFTNPNAKGDLQGAKHHPAADARSWEHMKSFFNELFK